MASTMERDLAEGRARFDGDGNIIPLGSSTWEPVDLGPALRGDKRPLQPSFLPRTDGKLLLYRGAPHVFYGESESLKTWAALLACRSFVTSDLKVLYLDFESNDVLFVQHLRQVGIPDAFIRSHIAYVRPDEALYVTRYGQLEPVPGALDALNWARETLRPSLIVVDGVSEAYAMHGWNINDATDAATFQRVFGRWGDDVTSIAIDHAGKDASRGQIGSQHKRAVIDGAQFQFTPEQRDGRGGHSIASIAVTKDRPGAVREFARDERIGRIHVVDDGVWIDPPTDVDVHGELVVRRSRVWAWVNANPGKTKRELGRALDRGASSDAEWLLTTGYLRHEPGPRGSHLLHVARQYPDD